MTGLLFENDYLYRIPISAEEFQTENCIAVSATREKAAHCAAFFLRFTLRFQASFFLAALRINWSDANHNGIMTTTSR